jgi:hypothetical protein
LIILPVLKQDYKWPEIRTNISNGVYPFWGEYTQFRDIGIQREKDISAIVSVWSDPGKEGESPI